MELVSVDFSYDKMYYKKLHNNTLSSLVKLLFKSLLRT